MICPVQSPSEVCPVHGRKHIGHAYQIATSDDLKSEQVRRAWGGALQLRKPSLPSQARSYISTLAEHIGNGNKHVPEDVRQARRTICNGCDRRNAEKDSCTACGCPLKKTLIGDKLGWAVSSCPLGKWGKYLEDSVASTEISSHVNRAGGAGISWPGIIRFDHANLFPGEVPGMRFNCSIIESGDGFIFAFRNGWAGSRLYLCRLTSDFKPVEKSWAKLQLPAGGQEDPRLFRLNGVLHLWYICYFRNKTSVRFCRINEETLTVEDEFFPQIPHRQPWEKNHSYFDYQGIAHAVYTVSPHKIIRVEGNSCQHAYNTPYPGSWSGGAMRGGASPVLHNGEYYHFFHGAYDSVKGRRRYCTGVYTFRSEPPFDVLRFTPHPIDQADLERQHDNWCDVLFIGGSLYRNGMWITANGVHDRWAEIRFYDGELIESQLEKVHAS